MSAKGVINKQKIIVKRQAVGEAVIAMATSLLQNTVVSKMNAITDFYLE